MSFNLQVLCTVLGIGNLGWSKQKCLSAASLWKVFKNTLPKVEWVSNSNKTNSKVWNYFTRSELQASSPFKRPELLWGMLAREAGSKMPKLFTNEPVKEYDEKWQSVSREKKEQLNRLPKAFDLRFYWFMAMFKIPDVTVGKIKHVKRVDPLWRLFLFYSTPRKRQKRARERACSQTMMKAFLECTAESVWSPRRQQSFDF